MSKKDPILLCFGTRPEWLKIKPLVDVMDKTEYKLFFTGQHEDLLADIRVDFRVNIEDSFRHTRLDSIMIACMEYFPHHKFRAVLVQGDTASAFACALAAFHRGIKVIYLEAGLRSYDLENPYPEEGYRQMIARLADINLAPTQLSAENLDAERVKGDIHIVGNTVLDNLLKYDKGSYGDTILVTMHRRENHHWLDEWFIEINELAIDYPHYKFILPIHPNPNVQKHRGLLTNINVVEPLTHDETINILKDCKLVITDSGGLQEEGSFFNKKVIVCRKTTERPEGIQTGHLHMCEEPKGLKEIFGKIEKNSYICKPCPYGDGRAAEKIKKILDEEL
jgi:UDP-N-acetylglucosamine 2-epimerase (non-hydrolysing)